MIMKLLYCICICTGIMTDELRNFLELSFQNSKAKEFFVGVADPKLEASISEGTKIVCRSNEFIQELLRGVRFHFERFIKDLKVVIFVFSFIMLFSLLLVFILHFPYSLGIWRKLNWV